MYSVINWSLIYILIGDFDRVVIFVPRLNFTLPVFCFMNKLTQSVILVTSEFLDGQTNIFLLENRVFIFASLYLFFLIHAWLPIPCECMCTNACFIFFLWGGVRRGTNKRFTAVEIINVQDKYKTDVRVTSRVNKWIY